MVLSQEAVFVGEDSKLEPFQRHLLYMLFIHSESLEIHKIVINLIEKSGIHKLIDYEIKHRDIIQRFGRYPHRNKILGRVSTAEEIEFLKTPGSGF